MGNFASTKSLKLVISTVFEKYFKAFQRNKMIISNFVKGISLLFKTVKPSYNINKIFRYILDKNIEVILITTALTYFNFLPALKYIYLIKLFIKNSIGNLFLSFTLTKMLSNIFVNKHLNISDDSKKENFKEMLKNQSKIIFYAKFIYLIDIILSFIIPFYNIFSVYFYGKYISEIYLDIHNVNSGLKSDCLSKLCFFRLGVGLSFTFILYVFEVIICHNFDSLLSRIILKDCIFNIVYAYYMKSFENIKNFPHLEPFSLLIPINLDCVYDITLKVFRKVIKVKKKPPNKLLEITWKCLPFLTGIDDPLKFVPIRLYLDAYRDDFIKILDLILRYEKLGVFLNENVISFVLSFWISKDITKLFVKVFKSLDYKKVLFLKESIEGIKTEFFEYVEKEEDGILLIHDINDNYVFVSQVTMRISPTRASPTMVMPPRIKIEIIDDHFK